MRRWLARLGFSFLIVSFVLFWDAYQRSKNEGTSPRVVLTTVGGALLAAAGFAGLRERHRPPPDDGPVE